MGILAGILLLSVIMILHEIGHYVTGRRLGFKVEEFSLFMGPRLLSKEIHGVRFSLKLFPIGASCRFAGEEGEEDGGSAAVGIPAAAPGEGRPASEGERFFDRPKWARAIVLTAGAAMNYLSGVLVFFILFAWFGFATNTVALIGAGSQAEAAGMNPGDRIVAVDGSRVVTQLDFATTVMFLPEDRAVTLTIEPDGGGARREVRLVPEKTRSYRLGVTVDLSSTQPVIAAVDPGSNGGSPALQVGDVLVSVNGIPYEDADGFSAEVSGSGGQPVTVRVVRDGVEEEITTRPILMEYYNAQGIQFLGEKGIARSALEAFRYSWSIVRFTVKGISMMIAGQISAKDNLSGPIGIVSMVGEMVETEQPVLDKIYSLLSMFGLISINLAFMNLLPIPPLDGNHLLLTGIEALRRKRLSIRVQTVISVVGFVLLIGLAAMAVVFDIMRLAGR
ncbi:MAG: RIP metalloprotease RseP [Clostridia bacterium]|nr:RIP metalloprotease RseP [Clostridia bacterium]